MNLFSLHQEHVTSTFQGQWLFPVLNTLVGSFSENLISVKKNNIGLYFCILCFSLTINSHYFGKKKIISGLNRFPNVLRLHTACECLIDRGISWIYHTRIIVMIKKCIKSRGHIKRREPEGCQWHFRRSNLCTFGPNPSIYTLII